MGQTGVQSVGLKGAVDSARGQGRSDLSLINRLAAVVLLALVLPVLLSASFLILATMGWPVFFTQARSGVRGSTFRIVKFRTMRTPRAAGESDESRITWLGRLLRRTSLDELPSLWNIVKGDMVFVGPRPLLPDYIQFYSARQARRLQVKPGITGWNQVRGRNALSWEEKLEQDVWYVDHRNVRLDLQILALTVCAVMTGRDVSHPGWSTMPLFKGTRQNTGHAPRVSIDKLDLIEPMKDPES
jgi:lipopolysaccharide/colanic/teichoic acid biosynthesis glycosyltransferase